MSKKFRIVRDGAGDFLILENRLWFFWTEINFFQTEDQAREYLTRMCASLQPVKIMDTITCG